MIGEMGPRFEELKAKQLEEAKALEEKRKLEAEERRIERALFQKCDHLFEDITEERLKLIEERGGPPNWFKALLEKKDPRAVRVNLEAYKLSKYEKCNIGCGLLRVSKIA